MTYALCGFANFGSLGIMIGGMSTMCPERRAEIVSLGNEVHRRGHARDLPHRCDGWFAGLSYLPGPVKMELAARLVKSAFLRALT